MYSSKVSNLAQANESDFGLFMTLQEFPLYMTVYFRHRQAKIRHS
jgi:hypothetical protein